MLFSSFPYDYPLLWTTSPVEPSYLLQLETHLKFLHASPPIIPRILHIAISIGFLGFFTKLFKPSESNLLFDGASLVLYVVGVIVYLTNIVKGLRLVSAGNWADIEAGKAVGAFVEGEEIVGREDSLRVLAASNTILALVLVGVLVLQAGQWYAESRETAERRTFEENVKKAAKEGGKGAVTRSGSKKKQ